ncbi:riboflavin biosynthesis protein Rib7 [Moelleriella libera RCEF 2490]|uniref:2,5-diamino-6-ribosylamino-4(3H)-pyrimidinone 5'-phosphate reductase n=1 Tax=Moelleriella libera RCEF 2490 TaxID=1081109 RepID=A0A166RKG0_9HYPO|nr:riboflavin biosynthesis protein Rib7 [Moelleriella libera RCEF 2490]
MAREELTFPPAAAARLQPHLHRPPSPSAAAASSSSPRPFVTLTFATSLDSALSLAPGVRTRLSGLASKSMTHFLRSQHAAILVGVSTVVADDPGLNCRLAGASAQPRPVIIDPHARWTARASSKVLQLAREGQGLAPFVLTGVADIPADQQTLIQRDGGKYIQVPSALDDNGRRRFQWRDVFQALRAEGLQSIMVEGGGQVINSLLSPPNQALVDSVIVTLAPTWLGRGSVVVSPDRVRDAEGKPAPVARLCGVSWHPLGEDVVLCGSLEPQPAEDSTTGP